MMKEIKDVFEVFNLDDISSDDVIDFNFPLPLDSEREEDKDQPGIVEDANVDLFQFMLPQVYCFKHQLGEYLIECLRYGGGRHHLPRFYHWIRCSIFSSSRRNCFR
jgi:hypothetical protein